MNINECWVIGYARVSAGAAVPRRWFINLLPWPRRRLHIAPKPAHRLDRRSATSLRRFIKRNCSVPLAFASGRDSGASPCPCRMAQPWAWAWAQTPRSARQCAPAPASPRPATPGVGAGKAENRPAGFHARQAPVTGLGVGCTQRSDADMALASTRARVSRVRACASLSSRSANGNVFSLLLQ